VVLSDKEFIARVRALAPEGIDHIVEIAFGVNIEADALQRFRFGKWYLRIFVYFFRAATISRRQLNCERRKI